MLCGTIDRYAKERYGRCLLHKSPAYNPSRCDKKQVAWWKWSAFSDQYSPRRPIRLGYHSSRAGGDGHACRRVNEKISEG